MAQINFPDSPNDGDEFLAANGTKYQYHSATVGVVTFQQPTTSDLDVIFSTPLSPGTVTFDQGSNPDNTSMKNFIKSVGLATTGDTFDFLWYDDGGNEDYAELIIDTVTVTNTNTMSGVSFTYTANSYTGIPISSPPPYSPTTITGSNVGGNYILTRYNVAKGQWKILSGPGTQGPVGPTGPEGPEGPIGATGPAIDIGSLPEFT